jgi:hypothetical protein
MDDWQVLPPVHEVRHVPQLAPSLARLTSHPSDARLLQSANPALQVNPHEVPLHVAVALAGVGQGEQAVPHVATAELLTHDPPQL